MLKLFYYLKPYALSVLAVLGLMIAHAIGNLYLPTMMSDIINLGVIREDITFILGRGGRMLLVTGGTAVCAVIATYLSSRAAMAFGRDLRQKLFSRVES